ncbi:MAG: nucleotidyltransferase domain-containing protein [Spirochaetales bacterium]|nr:nucleotidyltransferase domain-containing protein [Spirochaetales bacterium]
MNKLLLSNKTELLSLCKQFKVKSLYVFGSILTENFSQESDIDFIVSFEEIPEIEYSDFYFGLKENLEKILKRPVDLIIEETITNPYLFSEYQETREKLYG